jgi:hypothetical protein
MICWIAPFCSMIFAPLKVKGYYNAGLLMIQWCELLWCTEGKKGTHVILR